MTAPGDLSSSVQGRELFGPLPEMLEQRIRASGAAQKQFNNSSVVETSAAKGVQEEEKAVRFFSASGGLLQGRAQDEGERTRIERTCADHEVCDDEMVSDSHVFVENDTWESEERILLDDFDISIHMTSNESVHWTCGCLC